MRKKTLSVVLCTLAVTLAAEVVLGKELAAEATRPGSGQVQYEEPKYLTGAIYAPGSQQLLFKFQRVANRSGSTLNVQRDFTYPYGTLAARERVVYEGNALVRYELEEKQIGAGGSARIRPAHDSAAKVSRSSTVVQNQVWHGMGEEQPFRDGGTARTHAGEQLPRPPMRQSSEPARHPCFVRATGTSELCLQIPLLPSDNAPMNHQ